jgi:hypothetical protein
MGFIGDFNKIGRMSKYKLIVLKESQLYIRFIDFRKFEGDSLMSGTLGTEHN